MATLVAGPLILIVMAVFKWTKKESKKKNLFLSLDWRENSGKTENFLTQFNQVIGKYVLVSDLRRMDVRDGGLEATYFIDVENPVNLSMLVEDLKKTFSGIGITFIDQNQMPSI